jgi:DNA-binding transcriptional MerR regulator
MLTVSELARRTGLGPDTIRYYGRLGLLPEAGRTPGGHRFFDESAVERVRFIKGAQWFELRLDEIRELLEISDNGLCPCQQTKSLLEQRIAAIDVQRQRLDHIRSVLSGLLETVGTEGFNRSAMMVGADHRAAGCACHSGVHRTVTDEVRDLQARRYALEQRLGQLDASTAST